jgi:selenocysteine lyase/cysteine desulfurase
MTNWREEFAEFDDVTYLNVATQAPLPTVAARAARQAIEWKQSPHTLPSEAYFGLPNRIRALIARIIGAEAEEIAVTTGASGGLLAIASAIEWRPEDEVLLARGEFPAHGATWMPMGAAGRLKVKVVEPGGQFLAAKDFFPHISKRTRLVSTSLVRFDDAVRLDAPRLAAACRDAGAWLLLDVSQCAGALPMNARALGADILVCAGYKWLLSPYGTGFLWARREVIEQMPRGPLYWMGVEGAENFHSLSLGEMKPAPGARRWDAPETASFFNLAAMEASLEFVLRAGVENIWKHNCALVEQMYAALPRDRCVAASPADADARGPFACFAARSPEKTQALYERLTQAKVMTGLREGRIRVAPHLYNSPRDVDRLISVISV